MDYAKHGGMVYGVKEIIHFDDNLNIYKDINSYRLRNDITLFRLNTKIIMESEVDGELKTVARIIKIATDEVAEGSILQLGKL